jgi:uncharacterized protein (TIGR03435 family)
MLRTLLADRFQLQLHRETKDLPVYALVVGKNGPKLMEGAADTKFSNIQASTSRHGIRMTATHETMGQLAGQIGIYAGRPILDMTGLTGSYDFKLEWVQENPGAVSPDASDLSGASLLEAVQDQLGLKLEARKSHMEILVIDRAEKPSEN